MTKQQTERFLQIMLAWKEDRADDGSTMRRLLELYESVKAGLRAPRPR